LNIEFDSNDYLQDAEQAVCLLVEDGLLITFSHRSFQEYFVARFIYHAKPELQHKLIDRYTKAMRMDSVIDLLYEMNPELIERALLIPGLTKIENFIKVKRKVGFTHFLRFLKAHIDTISLTNGELSGFYASGNASFHTTVDFALNHSIHLIGSPPLVPFPEIIRNIPWEQYGTQHGVIIRTGGVTETHIHVQKLKATDNVVRDMALSGGYLAIQMLEQLLAIKKALIEKHENMDHSLEEILGAAGS